MPINKNSDLTHFFKINTVISCGEKQMNSKVLVSSLLVLTSCGQLKKSAQERQTLSANEIISDTEASSSVINDQFDDIVSALAQTSDTSNSSSLSLADLSKEISETRECKTEGGKAFVDIERSMEHDFENKRLAMSLKSSAKISRVWSHEVSEVECGDSNKYARVGDVARAGLKLEATFERSREVSSENKSRAKKRSMSSTGTQSISWIDESTLDGAITRSALISFDISRSTSVEGIKESRSYSSRSTANSIAVTIVRDEISKAWTSKLISSASVSSVLKNGAVVEANFENVLFENSETKCSPVSGAISGTIENPSDGESISFAIDFGVDENLISIGESEEELDLDACDLILVK